MRELLLRYTNYNVWANQRLVTLIIESLSEEQLDKEITSSFSSIRKTVYHIRDAEAIWLKRLQNIPINGWPGKDFSESFASATQLLISNGNEFSEYVSGLTNDELNAEFEYKNIKGHPCINRICDAVLHCMNHSTFHRGQTVTMLRQLEVTNLPATDYIAFFR